MKMKRISRNNRMFCVILALCLTVMAGGSAYAAETANGEMTLSEQSQYSETVVINEIESDGETGDWVEIFNAGDTAVDISGWYILDRENCGHGDDIATISKDTFLNPGEYYVFEENRDFWFDLTEPGSVMVFDAIGKTVDTYLWSAHASGVFARLPDGTGELVENSTATKGAANIKAENEVADNSKAAGVISSSAKQSAIMPESSAEDKELSSRTTQPETSPAKQPLHSHSYSEYWVGNAEGHWHICSCKEGTSYGKHDYSDIVNEGAKATDATYSSPATYFKSCSVCGSVSATETFTYGKPLTQESVDAEPSETKPAEKTNTNSNSSAVDALKSATTTSAAAVKTDTTTSATLKSNSETAISSTKTPASSYSVSVKSSSIDKNTSDQIALIAVIVLVSGAIIFAV